MAADGPGWDKLDLLVAFRAVESRFDTAPKGYTGLSIGANCGAKDQDRHHSCDLLSDYP
jgi:hypothetical protein